MDGTARLLRIYTDEGAHHGDRRVFEEIALRAHDRQLAGVTVLEARLGFGAGAHQRRRHALENDASLVVEIVEDEARLRAFAASLADLHGIGLMTMEAVEILDARSASAG